MGSMRSRGRSRTTRSERGAALVEFALVAPVLVLVLVGIIQFGLVLNDYQAIRHGVRDGARQAAVQTYGSASPSCTTASAPEEVKKVICLTKDRIGLDNEVRVHVRYFGPENDDDANDHGSVLICAQRRVDAITNMFPFVDGIKQKSSILMKMEKPISAGINTTAAYAETAPAGGDWSGC